MQFDEILTQVVELLQHQGRVSYRALKLRFQLDEEYIAGLKDELIEAQQVARDEDGKVLAWVGTTEEDKGKRIRDKGGNASTQGATASRNCAADRR